MTLAGVADFNFDDLVTRRGFILVPVRAIYSVHIYCGSVASLFGNLKFPTAVSKKPVCKLAP